MSIEDKRKFLVQHLKEIIPVLSEKEKNENLETMSSSELEHFCEVFETKLFSLEKKANEYGKDAMRVMVTANDPGAYQALKPVIDKLLKDERCKGVQALVSGNAEQGFKNDFGKNFEQHKDQKTIMSDIGELTDKFPVDVILGSVTSKNGSERMAMASGKEFIGAKRLVFLFECWSGVYEGFLNDDQRENILKKIDAICCVDEAVKTMIHNNYPEFPEGDIRVTGTPTLDSVRVDNPEMYINEARKKFGLKDDEITLFYGGDISHESAEMYGTNEKMNEKTWEYTLEQVARAAKEYPDRSFAVLLRPHPRDPNAEELFTIADKISVPSNLRIMRADRKTTGIQEVRYACDAVASIVSTENSIAPAIGRQGIFLAYGENLGGKIVDQIYSKTDQKAMTDKEKLLHIVSSPDDFFKVLSTLKRAPFSREEMPIMKQTGSAAERVVDVLFEKDI